jgi:predicted amidohydrolase YtcJ
MIGSGISIPCQPVFDKLWGGTEGLYASVLGKERALSCNRFRSIKDRDILLTGGSDWYISDLNVLAGIDAAVNMHNTDESITPYEALELYTCEAAKLSFDEARIGKIVEGFDADMVCLDGNPLQSGNIGSINVKKVIKKGKVVYVS